MVFISFKDYLPYISLHSFMNTLSRLHPRATKFVFEYLLDEAFVAKIYPEIFSSYT